MILLARDARGINQKELAKALEITQGNLSKIENGTYPLNDTQLDKISTFLNFPESFFYETIDRLPVNQQFHRKRKSIGKKYLDFFDSNITIRRLHIQKLLKSINIVDSIPRFPIEENPDPKAIAIELRKIFELGKSPIYNLVEVLEDRGLLILYSDAYEKIDGMAVPSSEDLPIIFLNNSMPPDRQRFTLAHEFGHIVMHGSVFPTEEIDVEKQADTFASEFLMPSSEFSLVNLGFHITLSDLANLKRYWYCSMASILYKLSKLGLMTPQRARSLNVELSRSGFKKNEPLLDVYIDKPSLLMQLIDAHLNELKLSKSELANRLKITLEEFNAIYYSAKMKIVKTEPNNL